MGYKSVALSFACKQGSQPFRHPYCPLQALSDSRCFGVMTFCSLGRALGKQIFRALEKGHLAKFLFKLASIEE